MAGQRKDAGLGAGKASSNTHYNSNYTPGLDALLSRLERVKQTGAGRWQARCPAHDDKGPSLSLREADDGKVLIHCFAGCSVHEVVGAVGIELSDLFPPRPQDPAHIGKPDRRPFPCADSFRAVAFEATIVALAGAAIVAGEPFNQFDKDRLLIAVGRINDALTAAGVSHHG